MTRLRAGLAACALVFPFLGCTGEGGIESRSPLPADRREYLAFREGRSELREPNYLPFLLHRVRLSDTGDDLLVSCRWPDEAFPLSVAIEAPEIPEALSEAPKPNPPGVYVDAVKRALDQWQRGLGPLVRFRAAEAGETPDIRIRLIGEKAPTPEDDKQVLGMTPLRDACRVGGELADGRLDVALHDVAMQIYVADDFGLLTPEQVEAVAAHEIGHALGARSHSPVPADLMFEIARDRLFPSRLSMQDLNSFAALYALPNGVIYARRPEGRAPEPGFAQPPSGPAQLADAPYVADELGFQLRLPRGWTVVPVDHGVAAVHGLAWDYDASLQVLATTARSIDEYLGRYGDVHLRKGPLLGRRSLEIDGRKALRMAVHAQESETLEEITLVEGADGRVLLVITEVPAESYEVYRPWLHAAIESLTLGARTPAALTPSS